MDFPSETVDLEAVTPDDETFRITDGGPSPALTRSISTLGLISPPLLLAPEAPAGYLPVCGFRRLAACRRLNWERVPARVVRGGEPDTRADCARRAVADNALQRPLSLLETARAVALLARFLPPESVPRAAGEAGLSVGPDAVHRLQTILTLPEAVQDKIRSGRISLSMATLLADIPAGEAVSLAELFETLGLGLNLQREILTHIREIARRESIPLADLLADPALRSLADNPDTPRPERAGAVRRYLRGRRYPALTEAETRFTAAVEDLDLGPDISLTPPPRFEGRAYTIGLRIENVDGVRAAADRLTRLADDPKFQAILSPAVPTRP